MDISALINLAVVGSDPGRVEVSVIDPIDIPDSVALGLAGIVSELVENATQYSPEAAKVRVSASAEPSGYVIQIVDRGLGVADDLLGRLNSVLSQDGPETGSVSPSGLPLVASLASRYGISVRLDHGEPGLTAGVMIPSTVIEGAAKANPPVKKEGLVQTSSPLTPGSSIASRRVNGKGYEPFSVRTEDEKLETEAFLESVFSPLRDGSVSVSHPAPEPVGVAPEVPANTEPGNQTTASRLATRVPGESYGEQAEDVSHTIAGEAAVEIRSALTDFDRGRRSAADEPGAEGSSAEI